MKVCIAEKPSVAIEIANILGANTKRDGYYEGNGYAVTYTFGHLCTLLEPKDYKPHWKSWDLNNLPMLPEKFETKVTIKVLGYIHGDGSPNEERPKVIKKETIVEISLPRERVILEDEIPWIKKDNKYRR